MSSEKNQCQCNLCDNKFKSNVTESANCVPCNISFVKCDVCGQKYRSDLKKCPKCGEINLN